MCYLVKEMGLDPESTLLWTDPSIVLQYTLNQSSRFQTYVANRVKLIQDNTRTSQWRHVPTQNNPADYASRGVKSDQDQLQMWLCGPTFLSTSEDNWPEFNLKNIMSETVNLEIKKHVTALMSISGESALDKLLSHFSSWSKLKVAAAWMIRFR